MKVLQIGAGILGLTSTSMAQFMSGNSSIVEDIEVSFTSHSDWMGKSMEYLGEKSLFEVTLPGTHDSGAYELTSQLVPGDLPHWVEDAINVATELHIPVAKVVTTWGKAQDLSIYDQLCAGARYIDLRSGWDAKSSTWRTFHAAFGNPIQTLLDDMARFLKEQPHEVIVVEVQHLEGGPSEDDMLSLAHQLTNTLGEWLVPYASGSIKTLTLSQLVSQGHRCLMTMEHENTRSQFSNLWPANILHNSYANSADLSKMMAFNDNESKRIAAHEYPRQLAKLSWTLTPDGGVITKSVLPGHPHSLLKLADKAGPHLPDFGSSHAAGLGQLLLMDHFEAVEGVRTALAAMCGACADEVVGKTSNEQVKVRMGVDEVAEGFMATVVRDRRVVG